MSVTSSIPDEDGIAFTAVGQPCFYCGEIIREDPAVHWMGAEADVYLHPPCVTKWVVRLFRDLHEIDCPDHYPRSFRWNAGG